MSKVVVVKHNAAISSDGLTTRDYRVLLSAALKELAGEGSLNRAVRKFVPGGTVGMKTNCLTRKLNSTPLALTNALCELFVESGLEENSLVVWERTNRELAGAGYELNVSSRGRRCLGTDATGAGYSRGFYSFGEVNSLVSTVLTDVVDVHVNLPVLKDHSIAGMSAALKNMYGAIHNPNKYHDNNCDPFCAHISMLEPIAEKPQLTVTDAMRVQYNGGPGYVPDYFADYGGIIVSNDAVAADRVGLKILEYLRGQNGQPTLAGTGRPVKYLETAAKLGLGEANLSEIDVVVLTADVDGTIKAGKLF
jgi:uncharacterized protein (DUF362 family)